MESQMISLTMLSAIEIVLTVSRDWNLVGRCSWFLRMRYQSRVGLSCSCSLP